MSEKPLLLSPAKSGVLVKREAVSHWWRWTAIIFGLVVVGVGAYDLIKRFDARYINTDIVMSAFAPLGTLDFSFGQAPATTNATSTATTAIQPQAATPLTPATLRIPSLTIEAEVEEVTIKADGKTMAAPSEFSNVAWYRLGSRPGEPGRAVFAGHLNSPILLKTGAFAKLSQIKNGDRVEVQDKDGRTLAYEVYDISRYKTELAPTEEIFSKRGPSEIVLVTCEGTWDPALRTFDSRLVVVARLLAP